MKEKIKNPLRDIAFEALSAPFDATPSPEGIQLSPATLNLVRTQVRALLEASPAFHTLPAEQRRDMAQNLVKIAAYSAALVQDDWAQSKKLGQTPVLRQQAVIEPLMPAAKAKTSAPLAAAAEEEQRPPAEEFSPRAASQVARITRETLNAIAFPTFVADLIKGTFNAIVDASIQQMEAYGALLANVAKTVDQFMADNISDNQARDYLAASYPGHFRIETSDKAARVRVRGGADNLPKPDFRREFGLNDDIDLDDDVVEESLVPAARRRLAQQRHSLLSTMMLMGINRIVVTSGRIRAQMGFRIDAKDIAHAQTASDFDLKNETTASYGGWFTPVSLKSKQTVTYVSSTKKDSSDELDVHADLTGEVDLKFKSDYFPMERFAKPEMMALVQGHTPNPAANTPVTGTGKSGGEPASAGGAAA